MADQHPVFRMVRYEWLAQETGYAHDTIRAMACGRRRCTPRFRVACARVLGRPEQELFHGVLNGRDEPAETGLATPLYATEAATAISHSA